MKGLIVNNMEETRAITNRLFCRT